MFKYIPRIVVNPSLAETSPYVVYINNKNFKFSSTKKSEYGADFTSREFFRQKVKLREIFQVEKVIITNTLKNQSK